MAIKRMTKADHPQSFGAFKPVGHVVVAMPDDERAAAAVQAGPRSPPFPVCCKRSIKRCITTERIRDAIPADRSAAAAVKHCAKARSVASQAGVKKSASLPGGARPRCR